MTPELLRRLADLPEPPQPRLIYSSSFVALWCGVAIVALALVAALT